MPKTRIMIAEDEVIIAQALKIELEYLGYYICPLVFSGEEAVKKSEIENPDIILMDINLRGKMNGIEAGNQIKSLYGIPVIYLTGYPDDVYKESAGVSKPYEYLIKPIESLDIREAVELVLNDHQADL